PHICRSLAIADALDLRTLTSHALGTTLDALTVGVFMLDGASRIVHMNQAAERQLKTGTALQLVNHCLVPTDRRAHDAMVSALMAARKSDPVETAGSYAIALPGRNGFGYIANILPIDKGERRALLAPFAAVAAVFVQD